MRGCLEQTWLDNGGETPIHCAAMIHGYVHAPKNEQSCVRMRDERLLEFAAEG